MPDNAEPGRAHHCFGCGARLDSASAPVSSEANGLRITADSARRPEAAQLPSPHAPRSIPARALDRLRQRERLAVGLLVLLVLALQVLVVSFRDTLVYDEMYYVPAARSVVERGEMLVAEHPPLGKLFIALGISVCGDNQWGWRITPVLFGAALVALFYYVCRQLMRREVALLAVALFAFETLVFNFAGLAMLVVFEATFMTLAFLLYLRGHYVLAGVCIALSGLCRLTGLLGGLIVLGHWLVFRRKAQSPVTILVLAASSIVAFLGLMPILDFATAGEWQSPVERISYMLTYYGGRTWAEIPSGYAAAQATPWRWLLDPVGYSWPGHLAYAQISPTVWLLTIPSMGYMAYEFVRRRSEAALFAPVWFASTCLVWIPVVLALDRVTYQYYFFPTVGAVCLAIAYTLKILWDSSRHGSCARHSMLVRGTITAYFALHLVAFPFLTPALYALDSHLHFLP